MCEKECIPRTAKHAINYSLGSGGYMSDTFSAHHSVPPQKPAWIFPPDLRSGASLILSVIPLPQIWVHRRAVTMLIASMVGFVRDEWGKEAGLSGR
jgi:hypothetical protein